MSELSGGQKKYITRALFSTGVELFDTGASITREHLVNILKQLL